MIRKDTKIKIIPVAYPAPCFQGTVRSLKIKADLFIQKQEVVWHDYEEQDFFQWQAGKGDSHDVLRV